eukprot:10397834-Ditylum_brightwellii.AAC.1
MQFIMYMYRVSEQVGSKFTCFNKYKLATVMDILDIEDKGGGIVYTVSWKYRSCPDKNIPRRIMKTVKPVRRLDHFIGWNNNDKTVMVQ